MTRPVEPDAGSATPSTTATSHYPRTSWGRLLRYLLQFAGILVVIQVALMITDPQARKFGTALGQMLFPFGATRRGHYLGADRAGRRMGSQ